MEGETAAVKVEEEIGVKEEEEDYSNKDLQQQSKALDKLTDRHHVDDQKQLDSTRVQEAMASISASKQADLNAMRLRDKELAAVKINPAEVDIIANELELDKKVAERALREHKDMVQEDEDEDVQEADVRGKKIVTKKPRETWPPEQEVALAKAWIQVSECKKFGNEQKPEGFWKRVFEHYATTLGSTSRTFHGLNTKWKTMNAAMGIFNGCYLQAKRAKASGCNDMDVMKIAMADYQTKTKKRFIHMLAWEVVKDHAKWVEQDCFQEIGGSASNFSKRKTGEYESASNENIISDMNEDPIPPFDSRKSKKKQGASSSSISSVADDISSYAQRKKQYLDEKREKDKLAASLLAAQLDGAKFRNRQREMKFFFEPHDHITDPAYLEVILADKREIAKKNGWPCDF